MVTKKNAY
jgi:hypothetical protein